jgi:hypothetical protein
MLAAFFPLFKLFFQTSWIRTQAAIEYGSNSDPDPKH